MKSPVWLSVAFGVLGATGIALLKEVSVPLGVVVLLAAGAALIYRFILAGKAGRARRVDRP